MGSFDSGERVLLALRDLFKMFAEVAAEVSTPCMHGWRWSFVVGCSPSTRHALGLKPSSRNKPSRSCSAHPCRHCSDLRTFTKLLNKSHIHYSLHWLLLRDDGWPFLPPIVFLSCKLHVWAISYWMAVSYRVLLAPCKSRKAALCHTCCKHLFCITLSLWLCLR